VSAKYNQVCEQATTYRFSFTVKTGSTAWNLTGYTATMTVRPFVGSTDTTLLCTTSNGRITLGGSAGTVTVNVDATTTGAIPANRYDYDLVLNSGSVITRLLEGQFIVTAAVTTSG
jgi:hypothetical protein